MDTTKTVLIVLAVGALVLAGALSFNLLSAPSNEYDQQIPSGAAVQPSQKATAQVTVNIRPISEVPR